MVRQQLDTKYCTLTQTKLAVDCAMEELGMFQHRVDRVELEEKKLQQPWSHRTWSVASSTSVLTYKGTASSFWYSTPCSFSFLSFSLSFCCKVWTMRNFIRIDARSMFPNRAKIAGGFGKLSSFKRADSGFNLLETMFFFSFVLSFVPRTNELSRTHTQIQGRRPTPRINEVLKHKVAARAQGNL